MTADRPSASRRDIESILTELARLLGRALARRRLRELRDVDFAGVPPATSEFPHENDGEPAGSA